MAFGIKIGSSFLDIDKGSQLTFEINTELWVTGEPSISTGSYSFPIDLPLTDNNRYLLRFPDRIDAHTVLDVVDGATIYIGQGRSIGLPVFTGRLFVKSASNRVVKVFLVVDGLSRENEKKFEDVDLGVFNLAPPLDLAAVMTYSAEHPQYYPFIFFPVWNETLKKTYYGTDKNDYFPGFALGQSRMNAYTSDWLFDAEHDPDIAGNVIITPFLRLEYILDKIVTAMGYTLVNEWMEDNDELKQICVFNNKSINDVEEIYKWKIRYNEHVPTRMLITEFLKAVAKFAFCGLFVNHDSKTVTMRPYRMVLNQAPRHNWTSRSTRDYEVEQDNNVPSYIGYESDNSDEYFSNNFVDTYPLIADGAVIADYWEAGGNPDDHSLIDGYYHVKRDNSVMRYDPSRTFYSERWSRWSHRFKNINIGGRADAVLSKCIPMWSDSYSPEIVSDYNYSIPRADIPLNINLKFDDETVYQNAELSSIRLMIYRGYRDYQGLASGTYPYANATAYDPATETESFNHSLHLDGDKGMYVQYGREWMEFMRRKKIVKRYLLLTLQDILNIRESDKVRIDNMDYFIKTIRVSVTSQGIGLSECTLVTIPFSVSY